MHRQDISRLRKNRPIYLKLGFILSLSFVLFAFNWTTTRTNVELESGPIIPEDAPMIQTTFKKAPKLPPPAIEEITKNIVEPELIEELPPEPIKKEETLEKAIEPEVPTNPVITLKKPEQPPLPIVVEKEEEIESLLIVSEIMPRFSGCEDLDISDEEKKTCAEGKMLDFIYNEIKYPAIARESAIQGLVVISFVVEKDGSIGNMEIMKDIGAGCGREAIRVAKKMPNWIPGRQRGKPVRVQYRLPVKFKLQ